MQPDKTRSSEHGIRLAREGNSSANQRAKPLEEPALPSGFAGRLDGATVADLVQLECAAGRKAAMRVRSRGRTGYLCFERGALVHALAPGAVGDAAVLQILGWQDGVFEPAQVRWPATPTVRSSWQHLVLQAAQAADESARGRVVEFPQERSRAAAHTSLVDDPLSQDVDVQATNVVSDAPAQVVAAMHDSSLDLGLNEPAPLRQAVARAVRLEASGRVVAARGQVESFSGAVAYGKRLGDLIGEELGAGRLRALKYAGRQTQITIYEEEDGHVVGLNAAPGSNLTALDGKLGL